MKRQTRGILLGLAILAGAAGLGVDMLWAVREVAQRRDVLESTFLMQSRASALAFSRMARSQLVRGSTDFLESAADLLIAGNAVGLQIVLGERILLERIDEGAGAEVDLVGVPLAAVEERATAAAGAPIRSLVDLILPLESISDDPEVIGYVRVLFDGRPTLGQIRAHRLTIWAIALGIALGGMGIVGLVAWRLSGRRTPKASASARDSERITAGSLTIDLATKQVCYGGRAVRLTPKQLELLALLATAPGRVFPDDEIVGVVWPTSPYANSSDVKQCIYTLRKRLKDIHSEPASLVENVQGYGYRLSIPEFEADVGGS